jgi:hypothetical protein
MNQKITPLNVLKRNQINCPNCKLPSIAPHTPFCSRRCARIDLGKWLNEDYVIPSDLDDEYIDLFHKLKQVDKNP